mmetsp:Transcript_31066/g.77488  ORF Transcript_31066/g.77488 Transcript_31066/m.77488 type:complete len:307 (-) Transcript_31066:283-1203(-)
MQWSDGKLPPLRGGWVRRLVGERVGDAAAPQGVAHRVVHGAAERQVVLRLEPSGGNGREGGGRVGPLDAGVGDVVEQQRRLGRHLVVGPTGELLDVEKVGDDRGALLAVSDEEEDRHHAPHLVPHEGLPHDGELPQRRGRERLALAEARDWLHLLRREGTRRGRGKARASECAAAGRGAHEGGDAPAVVLKRRVDLAEVTEVMLAKQQLRRLAHRRDVLPPADEEVLVRAVRGREARGEVRLHRPPREHPYVGRQHPVEHADVVDLLRLLRLDAIGAAGGGAHVASDHLPQRAHAFVRPPARRLVA